MAGTPKAEQVPRLDGARVLIVEARYHTKINDMLLRGAKDLLERAGCEHATLSVPGALEIPAAVAMALRSNRFDAFVALGCVIRGETTHYDTVAGESCRGLMNLAVVERVAIGNGILTVENEDQALERADPKRQDKGGHAALAALALLQARRGFEKPAAPIGFAARGA